MSTLAAVAPAPPLRPLLGAFAAAAAYGLAALIWVAAGSALPGGRWFAVHLFTIGVLTNVLAALTHHFAQTLLHTSGRGVRHGRAVLLNIGAILTVTGLPLGAWPVLAVGATTLLAVVLWLYADLRRLRRASLGSRFAFVVRGYERACGAFVHGGLLGLLMGLTLTGGLGVLGSWYGAARLAHLHVNVLGWGGLALLSTVVFFGPTVMRTRMQPGADVVAARALRAAATGLTVAALALLGTGAGDAAVPVGRAVAAAGLAVYAAGVTVVCRAVLQAGRRAQHSTATFLLQGTCGWFVAAVWIDVLVVATGWWALLETVGAMLLVGVLAQAILASLGYLLPMATGRGANARTARRLRLDRAPRARAVALNAGAVLLVVDGLARLAVEAPPVPFAAVGWTLVGGTVLLQLGLSLSPVGAAGGA